MLILIFSSIADSNKPTSYSSYTGIYTDTKNGDTVLAAPVTTDGSSNFTAKPKAILIALHLIER